MTHFTKDLNKHIEREAPRNRVGLVRRNWDRYGTSPGVISTTPPMPALAQRVMQFSNSHFIFMNEIWERWTPTDNTAVSTQPFVWWHNPSTIISQAPLQQSRSSVQTRDARGERITHRKTPPFELIKMPNHPMGTTPREILPDITNRKSENTASDTVVNHSKVSLSPSPQKRSPSPQKSTRIACTDRSEVLTQTRSNTGQSSVAGAAIVQRYLNIRSQPGYQPRRRRQAETAIVQRHLNTPLIKGETASTVRVNANQDIYVDNQLSATPSRDIQETMPHTPVSAIVHPIHQVNSSPALAEVTNIHKSESNIQQNRLRPLRRSQVTPTPNVSFGSTEDKMPHSPTKAKISQNTQGYRTGLAALDLSATPLLKRTLQPARQSPSEVSNIETDQLDTAIQHRHLSTTIGTETGALALNHLAKVPLVQLTRTTRLEIPEMQRQLGSENPAQVIETTQVLNVDNVQFGKDTARRDESPMRQTPGDREIRTSATREGTDLTLRTRKSVSTADTVGAGTLGTTILQRHYDTLYPVTDTELLIRRNVPAPPTPRSDRIPSPHQVLPAISEYTIQRAETGNTTNDLPEHSKAFDTSAERAEESITAESSSDIETIDLERLADKVYDLIEQRLTVERESLGL